jgi:hypothetical protein
MRQQWLRQKRLFEEPAPAAPPVQLSPQTQEQLREALFQWFQGLAKASQGRHGDE